MSLGNPYTILLAKENKRKRIFKTDSELSQNCAEKQIMPPKQQQIGYLMIYDAIYSLLVLIEKLAFFKKQL